MKTAKTYEIRIASPCSNDWEGMVGTERVRHCAQCDRDVHNFSAMTRREIDALLAARRGRLCGRYVQRADGSMVTRDTYPPAGQSGILANGGAFVALTALLGLAGAGAARAKETGKQTTPVTSTEPQSGSATIVVKDPSGAFVAGAIVTLTDEAAATEISGETNDQGERVIQGVAGSGKTFLLTIRMAGFETRRVEHFSPAGRQTFVLQVGRIGGPLVFEEPLQQAPAPQQSVVVGEIAPRQNSASKGDRKILVAKDATGAAIPQASVTLTNEKTGEVVKGETGPDGSLRVAKLKHGKYKVEIVHPAFRHATFDHVSLPAGKPPDYRLEVGAMMMGVVVITEGNPARRFFSRLWHKL
ncbi:MAG TPA: carboxypeptidase-like regulatory domain-containing protein [Dongiaceae bacterium]|nr:carboxypeptidase-like regulatory domain-containing protein [Dongiaceae bacterium]